MGKTKKVLAMFLAAVIMLTCTFAADERPARAYQDSYYGNEKVREWDAISEFNEGGILYRATKRPSGSSNGEVYVCGCTFRLESITIPAVVKHSGSKYTVVGINDTAFMNYENLTKVTIEDGLTYIGGGAFYGCWYLESITLPKTLKELGEAAFEYCDSLKSITFPDSLTEIPQKACAYSGISKVTFGKNVSAIKAMAFQECTSLKEITLPASLKTIEEYAFSDCRNLGKIDNKSKLKKADYEKAFSGTKWIMGEKKPDQTYTHSETDLAISIYLDNKKLSGGYLYYRMSDYYAEQRCLEYDDWELGVYSQLKKDSDGNYLLDKQYVSEYMYPVEGELYYCESKSKNFLKDYSFKFKTSDIPSASDLTNEKLNEDNAEGERIKAEEGEEAYNAFIAGKKSYSDYYNEFNIGERPVRLYTVHFEQGKYEALFLPEDRIISKYGYDSLVSDTDLFVSGFGTVRHPVSAARAFAYYADEKGNRIDNVRDLTGPVTLHPVFVNEDEMYKGNDYIAENDYMYSGFCRSNLAWNVVVDNVSIKKGTELARRLLIAINEKDGMCLIEKKVTLSRSELSKVYSGLAENDPGRTYLQPENGYFYNQNEFILIKSGGTLVIDGVRFSNGFYISLQKGAKLVVRNNAKLDNCVIGIQEGAELVIEDSTVDGAVINAGKITVKTPAYKRSTDSFDRESIKSSLFLNCSTGVIDLDYGALVWGVGFDMDIEAGMVKSDMRDDKDALVFNNGTVNVTGYGHINMTAGYQNREHKASYAKSPIVNNGTINIKSTSERYYLFAPVKIDHNSFYNYGTIKITSDVKRTNEYADSFAARVMQWIESNNAEIQLDESEFINYGTLDLDIKNGVGMSVVEGFFPRDMVIKRFEEDGDRSSHGRLENRKGGKINIVTDKGCGIAIGRNAYLINDGTVTIKEKDSNSGEPSLLIGGMLINNSKITNDGSIGYSTGCMYKEQKAYALDNGYSGKKWTGSGRELLGYSLNISGAGYEEWFNLYVTSGKSVLCDGRTYSGGDTYDTVFLPVNTKVKMTVKVSKCADKTVEYTTAKSVSDYFNDAYKRITSGSDPNNYIKISMTKGTGTADKSVTPKPMDINDQIIIGNMYYSVTTADLKGGTVCFEHTGYSTGDLVVPDTITYEGRTYKVTMFDYAGTDVTSVTLGKNIEYINQTAFMFSDKLKSITINSTLLKSGCVEYGAFDKVPNSCVITVPKKKLKGYKKIFKAAGLSKKVKVKGK